MIILTTSIVVSQSQTSFSGMMLKNITFTKPLATLDKGSFYYSSRGSVYELLEFGKSDEYHPDENRIDSLEYTYNGENKLTHIRLHRKNTVETDSIVYDNQGRIIECIQYSNKEDPYFEAENFTFKYNKDTIEVTSSQNGKALLTIDADGLLLSRKEERGQYRVEYQSAGRLSSLIMIENDKVYTTIPFRYNDSITPAFNFGNTPQWFCLVNPYLWFYDDKLYSINRVENVYCSFEYIRSVKNEKFVVTILKYINGKVNREISFIPQYIEK